MNREIKFRGWLPSYEQEVCSNKGNSIESTTAEMLNHGEFDLNSWLNPNLKGKRTDTVLMQYTGLKDENGVEIYEGDIIKYPNYKPVEVKLDKFNGYFAGEFDIYIGARLFDMCEVVGNIYQNPELINEKV